MFQPAGFQDPLLLKFLAMSAEHDLLLDVAAEYLLQHPQARRQWSDFVTASKNVLS